MANNRFGIESREFTRQIKEFKPQIQLFHSIHYDYVLPESESSIENLLYDFQVDEKLILTPLWISKIDEINSVLTSENFPPNQFDPVLSLEENMKRTRRVYLELKFAKAIENNHRLNKLFEDITGSGELASFWNKIGKDKSVNVRRPLFVSEDRLENHEGYRKYLKYAFFKAYNRKVQDTFPETNILLKTGIETNRMILKYLNNQIRGFD